MKTIYYTLKGKEVVKAKNVIKWANFFELENRLVELTEITMKESHATVSTVFIGLDYSFGKAEKPLVFETCVYMNGDPNVEERYSTWDEAQAGHESIVKRIIAESNPSLT